jgi:threonine dehydratase
MLTLVLPTNVSEEKRSRLGEYGTEIIEYGESCDKAELWARRLAFETGRIYVSPYNDKAIICGQGTIGPEILEDLPDANAVVVPVGGGGLIAGIAGYLRSTNSNIKILGVEPENSAFLAASLRAGRLVEIEEKETIAEAVAGGIEPGSMTFPLCAELLEGMITVEESMIGKSMCLLSKAHQKMVEGAGALSLAALIKDSAPFRKKKVVLVVSGGNISPQAFEKAVAGS